MCEPVTLFAISAGLALAQAGASMIGQRQQAKAQERQNQDVADAHLEASILNYESLERRRSQERDAAGQQTHENNITAMQAQERTRTAAGEAGVSGLSVDALLGDLYGQQARYTDSVAQNFTNTSFEITRGKENVHRDGVSTVNSLPLVKQPDYLGTTIQAAQSIFGAYTSHLKVPAASSPKTSTAYNDAFAYI